MLCAISNEIEYRQEVIKEAFKRRNGLKQVRGENKEKLKICIESNLEILFLRSLKQEIHDHTHNSY